MDQVVIEGGNRLIGIIEGIEVEIEVEETGGAVAKIVNVVEGADITSMVSSVDKSTITSSGTGAGGPKLHFERGTLKHFISTPPSSQYLFGHCKFEHCGFPGQFASAS